MIYFIQAGKNGPIKIGYTKRDPYERLKNLQTAHYQELNLIAIMPGNISIEEDLHRRFISLNIRGEWFYPSLTLMKFIKFRDLYSREGVISRRNKVVKLWDSGVHSIKEIVNQVYSSDGGRQRKNVEAWLKKNGRI